MKKYLLVVAASAVLMRTAQAQEGGVVSVEADPVEAAAPVASPPPPEAAPEASNVVEDPGFTIPHVDVHGFVNQGFMASTANAYTIGRSDQGTARFFDAALNVGSQLTDDLRVVMQLVAFNWDTEPGFNLRMDFAFADYHFSDKLGFRAGRFRQAQGLYNEVWDTESARVVVFLPQAIYTSSFRPYTLAANGLEIYGRLEGGAAGNVEYSVYGGTFEAPKGSPSLIISTRWTAGARLIYETPLTGLRVGSSILTGELDSQTILPADTLASLVGSGALPATINASQGVPGKFKDFYVARFFAEYVRGDFTLAAEYQRLHLLGRSDYPSVFPDSPVRNEGAYVMASYRALDWFSLASYVGMQFRDYDHRSTKADADFTFDYALAFRFDLNRFLALKVEGHYFDGTAVLNAALNTDPSKIKRDALFGVARICLAF